MICPNCGFENVGTSIFCERCGESLPVAEYVLQTEYKVPPPPPLNGHNKIPVPSPDLEAVPPPPPAEYEYGYRLFSGQKVMPQAHPDVFSGILYFASLLLAAFGLMAIVTTFGTTARIGGIALLPGVALVVVGVVVFIRLRQRVVRLRWWQRILGILAAAVVAFIALVIEVLVSPSPLLTNYFTACIIFLYGLVCAVIAVW